MEQTLLHSKRFPLALWTLFARYQIMVKGAFTLIAVPTFWICSLAVLYASGFEGVSSGNLLAILASPAGWVIAGLLVLGLIIMVELDMLAFIYMSALYREDGVLLTVREALRAALGSRSLFSSISGVVLLTITALLFPLVALGFTVSPFHQIGIPRFVSSVIFASPLYTCIFVSSITGLIVLACVLALVYPIIVLNQEKPLSALLQALLLYKKHLHLIAIEFIGKSVLPAGILAYVLLQLPVWLFNSLSLGPIDLQAKNLTLFFSYLICLEISQLCLMLIIPFLMDRMTQIYYEIRKRQGCPLDYDKALAIPKNAHLDTLKTNTGRLRTICITAVVAALLMLDAGLSLSAATYYQLRNVYNPNQFVVAHRAGGNLGPENSLDGLKQAIEIGVPWAEIDIQRTQDNHYIVNHDPSFSRVCGVAEKPQNLNYSAIQQLKIEGKSPVSDLESFLDTARGRIRLLVELKGSTADEAMVYDVVKMIRERNMQDQAVLIGLDEALISSIKPLYPDIQTGYIYFFSLDGAPPINVDYFIMEEAEATDANLDQIHLVGKKAIVWTVNTAKDLERFIKSPVDGIITDQPKEALALRKSLKTS